MSIIQQQSFLDDDPLELPPEGTQLSGVLRHSLSVAFLLDTSGSMRGDRATQMNWGMGEMVPILRKLTSTTLAPYDVRVQAIEFSNHAKALYSDWVTPDTWSYTPLDCSGGTNFAAAYDEWLRLLDALDSDWHIAPVAIILSDGRPNTPPTAALRRILDHPVAKHSQRAAVAVGHDADRQVLRSFVSQGQHLYDVDDPEQIAEAIIAATLASISGSVCIPTGKVPRSLQMRLSGQSQQSTLPTLIGGGLSPEEEQALRDAGISPNDLVS